MARNKFVKQLAFNLINRGNTKNDVTREYVFCEMSTLFSMIACVKNDKQAVEQGWSGKCNKREKYEPVKFMGNNAGIACGPASNVIVVDIEDIQEFEKYIGIEKYKQFVALNTFIVKTHKGFHFYFKYPSAGRICGNSIVKNHDNKNIFEVIGAGGYVMCPGSIHPVSGEPYTILNNVRPAQAPGWLLSLMSGESTSSDGGINITSLQ
ncbi:bifunctional DNA primase/polymerase [Fundidesulfovibrio terrae]|uniref:bifunctional DNA primase/polymerase n=1 Tax=Fundidesulfovibrio terrae TaxID=2922866 RepID=UPI001FAF5ADE|nr:bifunctional DNA primase/polymerase [Fundidesulfovibrio terrae]